MHCTLYGCITKGNMRVLWTRGALTPYLKLGGCGAVLLSAHAGGVATTTPYGNQIVSMEE